jgi:hypothetical protein
MSKLKSLYKFLSSKYQSLHLEYKVDPKPRFGFGKGPHTRLHDIISRQDAVYETHLKAFLDLQFNITSIKSSDTETNPIEPRWNNGFLPGLDIIGIYGMLSKYKPAQYIEIGSGNSTMVARKAIKDQELPTKITSIDPYPRADIDQLADKIVRMPLEAYDGLTSMIDTLDANDVLFIDNSHRVLPNSDATVCFLELIPYLKKGVIVHIHDMFLPYDYPQFMCDRYYNEQYMLAAFILANPDKYYTLLPNFYISEHATLSKILNPIWAHPNLKDVESHGASYWFQIR